MEPLHKQLEDALADPRATILVHGPVKNDTSGNSRARQSVYMADGELLFSDSNRRSYWYSTQNERQVFEQRGGLILSP